MLGLKSPYQLEPVNVLGAVMRARPASFRSGQEPLLDVIPDSPGADASPVAQLEDVDRFGVGNIEHDANLTVLLSTVNLALDHSLQL